MLVLGLIWTFNQAYYTLMAAIIVSLALFIYFKIRMIKSIRELSRKR
jgi:hypothetical protein